jgi:hypothetical protein
MTSHLSKESKKSGQAKAAVPLGDEPVPGHPTVFSPNDLETTLSDLAAELNHMHSETICENGPVEAKATDIRSPGAEITETPRNSKEHLVRNANKLFRRAITRTKSTRLKSIRHSESTDADEKRSKARKQKAGRNWNLFARSSKKSDEVRSTDDNLDEMVAGALPKERVPGETKSSKNIVDKGKQMISIAKDRGVEDFQFFADFLKPRKQTIRLYIKSFVLFLLIPVLCVSILLFHVFGNPTMEIMKGSTAISWFLIFVFIRQAMVWFLANACEILLIDFFALRTAFFVRWFGPMFTLLVSLLAVVGLSSVH